MKRTRKKVLIVSSLFAPQNVIGSVRATKFAKYLKTRFDYEVYVVTKKPAAISSYDKECSDLQYIDRIFRFSNGLIMQKIFTVIEKCKKHNAYDTFVSKVEVSDNTNKKSSKESKIYYFMKFIVNMFEERRFYKQASKSLARERLFDFDYVFSTYSTFANHWIANYVKHKNSKCVWVADYRDSVINDQTPWLFRHFCKRYIRMTENHADCITAVSQGCIDSLCLCEKTHYKALTNGFDKDDLSKFDTEKNLESTSYFVATYCGSLYSGKSDLSMVFQAFRELIDAGDMEEDKLRVQYAGSGFDILYKQAKQYHLENRLLNAGYVPKEKSIEMQLQSDILLLASWNQIGETGIVTGKFLEYLMINKPILCTITGDLPNSILKKMIAEANAGVCCEKVNFEQDFQILKNYILAIYQSFSSNNSFDFYANQEYIQRFDYSNITDRLNRIFSECEQNDN